MRRIGLLPFVLFGIAFSLTNSIAQIDPSSLVNPFTGSLQYSTPLVTVPGPAGSGITINLQYSSDVRPEQEASWVGFGWSLDLPMITRAKRGLPDDYYDAKVVAKHNVPDHTISMIRPLGMTELFKIDNPLSLNLTIIDDSERGMDVLVNGGLSQALSEISSELNGLTGSWTFQEGSSPSFGITASRSSMYNSGSSWFKIPNNVGLRFNQRRTPTFMSPQMSSVSMSTVNVQGTFKTGVNESDAPEIGLNVTSVSVQIGDIERRAFGFMYAPEANTYQNSNALLDYSVERPSSMEAVDRPFAPYAVGDADLFQVSGQGVSGTFRVYHRLPFEVRPALTSVVSKVQNIHSEIMVLGPVVTPTSVTKGFGFGSVLPIQSETSFTSGAGPQEGDGSRYAMQKDADVALDRNFIFRYISDPADELKVSHHDSPVYGELKSGLGIRDFHELNRDRPIRSNAFVKPLFVKDIDFWNVWPEIILSASLGIPFNNKMLVGFETVSPTGQRFVFDQPVGVANEEVSTRVLRDRESLDRSAPRVYHIPSGQAAQDPVSSYQEYHEVRNLSLYADAFFVTSITTPDYADKGAPGLDNEDDGGWTKFTYQLVTSRQDVRSPYNGYWFDKGQLENPWDDKLVAMRASRTSRVVKTIETPTHIAKFFTNRDDALADRKDAWGAQIEQVAQTSSTDKNGENRSVYLTRVELHKKLQNGQTQLISTTHLAYDYSLVPGNPSSSDGVGKLSLRKVWTEMGKVKDAYISPTEFYYEYPTLLSSGLTTASTVNVGRLTSLYSGLSTIAPSISPSAQNPQFDPNSVDAWGLPGAVGVQSGITKFRTSSTLLPLPYDPTPAPNANPDQFAAPYTLKRIHAPSGAEVLVRYEPSDYSSVQDSSAMAYMPLLGNLPTQPNTTDWNQNQFAVSIAAISGTPRRTEYLNELRRRFVSGGELLQGKFVYQLGLKRSGRTNEDNALTSVKTYVKVFDVSFGSSGANNSTVVFTVGSPTPVAGGNVDIRTLAERTRNLPFYQALINYRESSRAYFKAAKSGNVLSDAIAMCDLFIDLDGPEGVDEKDNVSVECFPTLIPQASKLRLPCIGSKQSNVPRVRMIAAVSPDGMLQTNDASVVGREFTYTEVGKFGLQSSGVATQEPVALRDVMGLVQAKPELLRELAGNPSLTALDIERVETPLGESFLPGASIGYARIVERSIFDGEANTGTVVRRFLTAREVPTVRSEWLPRIAHKKESTDILQVMFDYSTSDQEVQQGYAFHIREGHGLPLSVERYSGRSSGESTSIGIPDGLTLLSSTKWYYDAPESEELLFDTLTRPLRLARYGCEMEITGESKLMEISISNVQLQYGLSLTIKQSLLFPPSPPLTIPFASASPSWQYVNNTLTSYVSTKVVRHPLRLRSIVSMQDGARDSAEIVAYDSRTGYPALNQSFDGYNGLVLDGATSTHLGNKLSVQVPALRAYAEMGHRSEAEGLTFVVPHHGSPSLDDGGLWTGGVDLSLSGSQLTIAPKRSRSADVVKSISAYQKLFTIGDVISLSNYDGTSAGTAKVTAVTYTTSPQPGLQLDLTGITATPSSLDRVKILRSARTNQLVQQIAQYQAYGVDLTPSKDYAKMLRDRERTAEILTDLTRAGSSYIGMKWWRPLVRHYMYPRDIAADEDAIMLSKLYSNTVSVCDPRYSPIELVIQRTENPAHSLPASYDVKIEYQERLAGPLGTCTLTPIEYYASTIPSWTRWRRFFVSDRGDLVHGIDPDLANDTRQNPDLKFGFRDELWTGDHPSGWDFNGVVKTVRPIADPPVPMAFLSAQGTSYKRFNLGSSGRGVYRPFESYVAKLTGVHDGQLPTTGKRVYNSAGAFSLAQLGPLWNPHYGTAPAAPWQFAGAVRLFNRHGLPVETEDATRVPTATRYSDNGYLPKFIAHGASAATLWGDDCEYIAPLGPNEAVPRRPRHTGLNGKDGSFTETINLPAVANDTRLSGTSYTVRLWLKLDDSCPIENWTVSAGSTTLTGTGLASHQVGFNQGYGLFEFEVPGSIPSVAVNSTSLRSTFDDIAIRPTESTLSQIVYDDLDRPMATLDDQGWPSYLVYNEKGSPNRVVEESSRGRNMVLDMSSEGFQRRRSTGEIAGGIHSSFGFVPMIGEDIFRAALPMMPPVGFGKSLPSGLGMKQDLLRFDATLDRQSYEVLPTSNNTKAKENK